MWFQLVPLKGCRGLCVARLVLEEEVPVDGDLGASLRTPPEAERALAGLTASRLWFAAVDIPHAERDGARCLDDDLVLIPGRRAEVHCTVARILLVVDEAAV